MSLEELALKWREAMQPLVRAAETMTKAMASWVQSLPPELLEALATEAEGEPMKTTRQAVMKVSRELLEQLMPDFRTAVLLRFGDLVVEGQLTIADKLKELAVPFHRALKLPANCRITGISHTYVFDRDEIAFRIESPDFVETPFGCVLPEVQEVYQNSLTMRISEPHGDECSFEPGSAEIVKQSGYFLRWDGLAVAVHREYGPDGEELPTDGISAKLRFDQPGYDWGITELFEKTKKDAIRQGVARQAAMYAAVDFGCDVTPDPSVSELEQRATLNGLPVYSMKPCWKCGVPTARYLDSVDEQSGDLLVGRLGTPECLKCAEKPLL